MSNQINTYSYNYPLIQTQNPSEPNKEFMNENSQSFNTLLYNRLQQHQQQFNSNLNKEEQMKDHPMVVISTPGSNNQNQYSFGNNIHQQNQVLNNLKINLNVETNNIPIQPTLQSPSYIGDVKNPQNYLYITSLPGSKYGSQTQLQSAVAFSQSQLSSHNLQSQGQNQKPHQHQLTAPTPQSDSNRKQGRKSISSQPEIKTYKEMKAVLKENKRESKLLTPTSAFSPEIQKVIEEMKQRNMLQTNDAPQSSSEFNLYSQAASQKSESHNTLPVTQDVKKDLNEQRRLSSVEVFQIKSNQIVQDLNSIQQQLRHDSANTAIKRTTLTGGLVVPQTSQQRHSISYNEQRRQSKLKFNENIQSLTSLDNPTGKMQFSKFKQKRNSITSEFFVEERAKLKEFLLSKNNQIIKNKSNTLYNQKFQAISLPDISRALNSQSELGSDKKHNPGRQVKTKGSLEHLEDQDEIDYDLILQDSYRSRSSNKNSSSNQSSVKKKKNDTSIQDDCPDSKSDSPTLSQKASGSDMSQKYSSTINNVLLKQPLDSVNEVFQDQDSKLIHSPQFMKRNHQDEEEPEKLSSVDTFSSNSSDYIEGSPTNGKFKNQIQFLQKKANDQKKQQNTNSKQEKKIKFAQGNDQEKKKELNPKENSIQANQNSETNQEKVKKTIKIQVKEKKEYSYDSNFAKALQSSQEKEKSLQSSIVSLKNEKISPLQAPAQNSIKPITISDIQPYQDSDKKKNNQQYQIQLTDQNQFNITDFSPIRYDQYENVSNQNSQFFGKNPDQQSGGSDQKVYNKDSSSQVTSNKPSQISQSSSKQSSPLKSYNSNNTGNQQPMNNMEQINQKLLQNQILQINKQDKGDKNFSQQAFNSFGSDVDLQQLLTDIQYKQEEEKRIQLQNQLIEARLEQDINQRSILTSINPSPKMTAINQQGYFGSSTTPLLGMKSYMDLVGSDILVLNSESNYQTNPSTFKRASFPTNQLQQQNNMNIQERINSRIHQQMPRPIQFSPRTIMKKEELRAVYYQKDAKYSGDGKLKTPKRTSVKSISGCNYLETEYYEEELHETFIISDHCIESEDRPIKKQQQKPKKQQSDYNIPSYLRSTKAFTQSVINAKNKKQTLQKFKFK